ncbi:TPA: transporter substrate-binding domain-containing protein [Citrobacter freundii]
MPLSKPLRFAINLGNAMLATKNAHDELQGLTVELAKKMADACGRPCALLPYPAARRIVDDAGNGQWDIAFLAVDPAREDELCFTAPYLTIDCTLLVRRESPLRSVQEMDRDGIIINVGKGAAYSLPLIRLLKRAQLREYPTTQEALQAFLAGEGDMAANIRLPLEAAAQKDASVRVLGDNYSQIRQAICVPRAAQEHYAFAAACLQEWRQDGSLDALIAGTLPHE